MEPVAYYPVEALVKPLDVINNNPTPVYSHTAHSRMEITSDERCRIIPVQVEMYQISTRG
ncbi:hypothetical protein [Marseilla massiliensis]|uniref:Uncharacterized protein n=1 Tax=Marseilla massiliensis TaxID=1841864 RepID=A0A938WS70_9BACT|nr:hypothetical protein [Marseilla massiliensis]MBM6673253.1 hypothetical protein [Marseilla massiliensis]